MKSLLIRLMTGMFILAVSGVVVAAPADMRVVNPRCEYGVNPLGIDQLKPRLSWELQSDRRNEMQTAYRVIVSSSPEKLAAEDGDLWDSGRVESDRMAHVEYGGDNLGSGQKCWWTVCVWDADGRMSAFSDPAFWTMGLLSASDWQAEWIARKPEKNWAEVETREPGPTPPHLRKEFSVNKAVKRATVYATARGMYEMHLNGRKISDAVFAPGWTDFNERIQYQTYDVTDMIRRGDNVIGGIVGDGWYAGRLGWRQVGGYYGFDISLLARLEIEYTDGSKQAVVTDDTWRWSEGPIRYSDFMMGEMYDANYELPGWCTFGFDADDWQPVVVKAAPDAELVSQPSPFMRVTKEIPAVDIAEPVDGVYVFNIGQNIAGWARLKVRGPKGTVVTMRFGERLNSSGTVYTTNLRSAEATDVYVLKGEGEEVFEPHFTFHGFQYVEIVGYPGKPELGAITGCAVHSDTPEAGTFVCSNGMVNKLVSNIQWGQRGNFISVPTDCPQRDERLGWMGDAQIFVKTATYNMDVAGFFTKWMDDVDDARSDEGAFADFSPDLRQNDSSFLAAPGWGDAGIIIPWTMYKVYGDTRIIDRHWDAMEGWMSFMKRYNPDLIRRKNVGNNYGDWLSIKADTPKDLLATAYWAYDAGLMAEMARATGRTADAAKYDDIFRDVREVFNHEFVNDDGRVFLVHGDKLEEKGFDASGTERTSGKGETQTNYVLALYMDLLPDALREKAASHLIDRISDKNWHLSTGFIGVRHLNPVLSMTGRNDVAYRLFLNDTFPSWGYSIRHGATTIWERWDGWTEHGGFQDPGMNSFNHYSLGSVGEWLYGYVAGIDMAAPGFREIVIKPHPDHRLGHAQATYHSISGPIESGWRYNGDKFVLDVTIPANTTADVYVPSVDGNVRLDGKNVDGEFTDGYVRIAAGSGSYRFESTVK